MSLFLPIRLWIWTALASGMPLIAQSEAEIQERIRQLRRERDALLSPLLRAVKSRDLTAVTASIDQKENVGIRDGDGWTPLHFAAGLGQVEICRKLLDAGSQPQWKTDDGRTPLHIAVSNDLRLFAAIGHQHLSDSEVPGRVAAIALLLGRGALINTKDNNGLTALHWAAVFDNAQYLRVLLNRGAVINAVDAQGNTPLHHAVSMLGGDEAAGFLITAGARLDIRNRAGRTVLDEAKMNSRGKMVAAIEAKARSSPPSPAK